MSFLSWFKTFTQKLRHGASNQSNRNAKVIHFPVNDKQGVDLTEAEHGEIPGSPIVNDTETRSLATGPLNPNLEDSAYHPIEQITTPSQPTIQEQQPIPETSLLTLQVPTRLQIGPRNSSSTITGTSLEYSFNSDSDSSSYTSGSETSSKRSRRRLSAMDTDKPLNDKLHKRRVECGWMTEKFFIPQCALKELINESVIENAIRSDPNITDAQLTDYLEKICQNGRRLFATLAYMKKESQICRFVCDGVTDEDLPLRRKSDDGNGHVDWPLEGRNGKRIEALENWKPRQREKFSSTQRLMTSPVFEYGKHYELDNSIILPFIDFKHEEGKQLEFRGGGYSEVLIKCIHPSHHAFWESSTSTENPLVAIKRLISPDEIEFRKEETILKRLGPRNHRNLIRLLATFRHENKWHLIFPYADGNLLNYWERIVPIPNFDEATVLWSLKQMYGIADGVQLIHNFDIQVPLPAERADEARGKGQAFRLSVQPGEERYGRHGDIKPENILWFEYDPEFHDPNGVLKIADFGLGRFHGRDSRSKVNPRSVCWSPTYEPPELKLGTPVSRAYDFWSLGGLYLEYVSWLLGGWTAVTGFSNRRALEAAGAPGFSDDNYFSITTGGDEPVAHVRDGVTAWVKELHQHEKCSALIHEFLQLIIEEMLVIDSKKRIEAADLQKRMQNFVRKAEEDKKYLLEPKPWPKDAESNRYSSPIPSHKKSKKTNSKGLSVTFSGSNITHLPRSPTPSPTRSPTRSDTWPGAGSTHPDKN